MTADDYIRFYYRTRDSFGAPALDFVDSTGRMFAKKCERSLEGKSGEMCGSKKRKMNVDGNWVCDNHRCGKPWAYVDAYIFKGEVQKSKRVHTFDDTNARYFDVAIHLYKFLNDRQWKWGARLYVAHAVGWSIRRLVSDFHVHFPAAPMVQRSRMSERVVQARMEWEIRLHEAGLPVQPY